MQIEQFNQQMLDFLQRSPTPFHAVSSLSDILESNGFVALRESDTWVLQPGGRYYVVRNGSSIIAFVQGSDDLASGGIRMVGAHTDSPCLKVKPQPEIHSQRYLQLGVEVYGGVLLNPWFDRDLSMAGRVTFENTVGDVKHKLINFKRAIAIIPSLAIHLDREANKNRTINPQKDIPPILAQCLGSEKKVFSSVLMAQLEKEHPNSQARTILDFELCFYDTQPPAIVGLEGEFITSARLDNLLSCYCGVQAIIQEADQETVPRASALLVCNDHEEVGSASAVGANGPMLRSFLDRITTGSEDYNQMIYHSMMISADNAHGVHPNYADKHDGNHGPLLNAGPVIKINANQRYASNSETSALFKQLCKQQKVNHQTFVVRTDMGCGSTIGPITAAELGVKTIDVGVPTFAMHSVRETAGSRDAYDLYQVMTAFMTSDKSFSVV